ncbi:peptidoglycan DD-metalloendopeptidase family protein [Alkalibacterium indicireducens]|uniref:Murein DD-endopeptidase MepM and murein hydrolase activator NlpD, contain LysM domain n=1 Tax=Alkalibacterium indicireducens TaxID=398758 RepID=A0ABP3L218_9LACT
MKKKFTLGLLASVMLAGSFPIVGSPVQAENLLDELKQEKEEVENRSGELDGNIENTEQEMEELAREREELEASIQALQISISELTEDLIDQNDRLDAANKEIDRLNEQIDHLNVLIEQRNEKLMQQARSTQTQWNPTRIIHIILSAENLSDLISRMGIVSQLVSANRSIIEDQIRDQQLVKESEEQVQAERVEVQNTLNEMEATREQLSSQQVALDDEIMHVAELYEMNEKEKESFISEQYVLAQQAMTLSSEIQSEEERRLEEQRRREEEERRRAEEEAERQAIAEAARLEAEREEQARAEEEASQQAAAERREAESSEHAAPQQREEEARQQAAAQQREEEARQRAAAQQREDEARRQAEAEARAAAQRREQEAAAATSSQSGGSSSSPSPSSSSTPSSVSWSRPASGRLTSPFGFRIHPIFRTRRFHSGIDIAGSGAITATRSGTVRTAGFNRALGYYIDIDHGDGYASRYAHLQPNMLVSRGQSVSQGQRIGTMGTTGDSTGVHLHFEIHKNGQPVNPLNYVSGF